VVSCLLCLSFEDLSIYQAIRDVQAHGSEGDDASEAEDGGKTLLPTSSGDLAEELKSPADSGHLHHDPSMQSGTQSSI
jgi:hypothetical protein